MERSFCPSVWLSICQRISSRPILPDFHQPDSLARLHRIVAVMVQEDLMASVGSLGELKGDLTEIKDDLGVARYGVMYSYGVGISVGHEWAGSSHSTFVMTTCYLPHTHAQDGELPVFTERDELVSLGESCNCEK